jgi:hypothetical protein
MTLKEIFKLTVVFSSLFLISCDDPEVMAVPDYMTELYSTNEACPDYDYVTIDSYFPLSKILHQSNF